MAAGLVVGSVVAPVWPPTGGGSAMGGAEERKRFVGQVRKACRIARKLARLGMRPYGVVRIDSAPAPCRSGPKIPRATRSRSPQTFREAAGSPRTMANGWRPKARSAGAACIAGGTWCICWNGGPAARRSASRPTWRTPCSSRGLQRAGRPHPAGGFRLAVDAALDAALAESDRRPAPLDHRLPRGAKRRHREGLGLARQDRPPLPAHDPNGKLDIVRDAGYWMRDEHGHLTRACGTSAGMAACSRTQ